jgi:NADH:ubiquinone oxidoreductase subunit
MGIIKKLSYIGLHIDIMLWHKYVGSDLYGNKYYIAKCKDSEGNYRRTVVYNGQPEASRIPPLWHSWMHYTSDDIPENSKIKKFSWQKDFMPNLTGTKYAYSPIKDNHRNKATGDYNAWNPENKE